METEQKSNIYLTIVKNKKFKHLEHLLSQLRIHGLLPYPLGHDSHYSIVLWTETHFIFSLLILNDFYNETHWKKKTTNKNLTQNQELLGD